MGLDRDKEAEHLSRAETHITDGERRVIEQRVRLEQLRADGHETAEAERFLVELERTLVQLQAQRDEIVRTLAQIDAGLV